MCWYVDVMVWDVMVVDVRYVDVMVCGCGV